MCHGKKEENLAKATEMNICACGVLDAYGIQAKNASGRKCQRELFSPQLH